MTAGPMRLTRARQRARARRDEGARGVALIELAICIFVLLVILYGVAELAFIYRSATAVNSATRAGARLAAATYTDAPNKLTAADLVRTTVEEVLRQRGNTDQPTFLRIYRAGANGLPADGTTMSACSANCLRYTWNGTNFVYQAGTWPTPVACGGVFDRVGVYVEYQHSSITGIVNLTGAHGERTVMRLEPSVQC